jgi:hypothetical protein
MQSDNWDFSQFDIYKSQYTQTKLYKVIINNNIKNKYYYELDNMLNLAEEGKSIKIKGGIKYSVAKFINRYHKLYKWKKQESNETFITCCVHYPKSCGGYPICKGNKWLLDDECYCSEISSSKKHKIIWNKLNYDDNCMTYCLQPKTRYFEIKWNKIN